MTITWEWLAQKADELLASAKDDLESAKERGNKRQIAEAEKTLRMVEREHRRVHDPNPHCPGSNVYVPVGEGKAECPRCGKMVARSKPSSPRAAVTRLNKHQPPKKAS